MRNELVFLRAVIELVSEELKELDIAARWGGGTILTPARVNATLQISDREHRVRRNWEQIRFWHLSNDLYSSNGFTPPFSLTPSDWREEHIAAIYETNKRSRLNPQLPRQSQLPVTVSITDFDYDKSHFLFVMFCTLIAEGRYLIWDRIWREVKYPANSLLEFLLIPESQQFLESFIGSKRLRHLRSKLVE